MFSNGFSICSVIGWHRGIEVFSYMKYFKANLKNDVHRNVLQSCKLLYVCTV